MLETPDLRCWGRSDQLHLAFVGILMFQKLNKRLPSSDADADAVLELSKTANTEGKAAGKFF
jgi:hypothetical protein